MSNKCLGFNFTITAIWFALCLLNRITAKTKELHFNLTEDSGSIQTPNFPAEYPSNIECIWHIRVQPGRFILLSFDVFEVETSYNGECIADIMEIKDGNTISSPLLGSYCDATKPNVTTSSGNYLRIWFSSDGTKQYQGFSASYTSQWEDCGGSRTQSSGSIYSPRHPIYPYPSSIQCDWTITVPRDKFIRLDFSAFEVEYTCYGVCSCKDKLELWDGPKGNATKVASFCVSVPRVIVSKSNRIKLRFSTNKEGRFNGFHLSYTTSVTPYCGGDIKGTDGFFVSPNYPMSFPAFSDCTWRIEVPDGQYISLRFEEFTGINGSNSECTADSIEVRDGYTRSSPMIERYCGQNLPPVIVSSRHQIYVHFRARSDVRSVPRMYRRFNGSFKAHSRECNESIGLQDGRIKNSQLSASSYYTLQFTPQYGRLWSRFSWCSQAQALNTIVGEYLQIDLLNLTEITAVVTQGYQGYPGYQWGFVTRYKIEYSYDETHWITVMRDDENSTKLGYTEFDGNTDNDGVKKNILDPSIMAKTIRIFPTDYKSYPVRHMCVRAELYGCPYDSGCGGIFSIEKPGKISARGMKLHSAQCTWFSIPSRKSLTNDVVFFHFTYFDVPCHLGHVILHVRNGGKMTKLCGVDPPPLTILLAENQVMVKIELTKPGKETSGFDLNYQTEPLGCGQIIEAASNGTLTSPNYPQSYESNHHCTWILSSIPGSNIVLRFIEFDLPTPNKTECLDYLEIRDGRLDTSTVLGPRLCGNKITNHVTSTFNHVRITFHSDEETRKTGFLLEYNVIVPRDEETILPTSQSAEAEVTDVPSSENPVKGHVVATTGSADLDRISSLALLSQLISAYILMQLQSQRHWL